MYGRVLPSRRLVCRPIHPILQRHPGRTFSSSRSRPEENTYFSRHGRPTQVQSQPPVVVVQSDSGHSRGGAGRWQFALLGFISFPVIYLASTSALLLFGFLAPDSEDAAGEAHGIIQGAQGVLSPSGSGPGAPASAAADLATLVERCYQLREELVRKDAEVRNSDYAGLRLTKLFIEFLTPRADSSLSVIRDEALLNNPPVPTPDDAPFLADPSCASLIRIVDAQGKNRALILGVDVPPNQYNTQHRLSKTEALEALSPVWRWLFALGEELHHSGANADMDVPLFVWQRDFIVENSLATERPNFLMLTMQETPPGFPMAQLNAFKVPEDVVDHARIEDSSVGVVLSSGGSKSKDTE